MKEKNMNKSGTMSAASKRALIILVSVFLGAVILFGATLGIVSAVRSSRAYFSYKGVTVPVGVVNYLAATRKSAFMSTLTREGVECYDKPEFWNSKNALGVEYGEVLEDEIEHYVSSVIVGAYLFDRYTSLTKEERESLKTAQSEVLEFKAGGSRAEFNRLAEPMGFDYSDFTSATELIYKYNSAKSVIFGYNGASLSGGDFTPQCDEFFDTYSHVMLMFIRTEGRYVINEETGLSEYVEFTDGKKAEIQEEIAHIRTLINAAEEGVGDERMSPDAFLWYILNEYNYDEKNAESGYYFAPTSSYTQEFADDAPDVVSRALALEEGHYAEAVADDLGVCFIYKYPCESGAYYKSSLSHFFGDFYADAADYLYAKEINELIEGVKIKDKFYDIDLVSLPYNYDLIMGM